MTRFKARFVWLLVWVLMYLYIGVEYVTEHAYTKAIVVLCLAVALVLYEIRNVICSIDAEHHRREWEKTWNKKINEFYDKAREKGLYK